MKSFLTTLAVVTLMLILTVKIAASLEDTQPSSTLQPPTVAPAAQTAPVFKPEPPMPIHADKQQPHQVHVHNIFDD